MFIHDTFFRGEACSGYKPVGPIISVLAAFCMVLGIQGVQAAEEQDDCIAAHGIHPICKVHNPEDLMVVPGTNKLIVSQIGHKERPGSLALLDTETEEASLLYPMENQKPPVKNLPLWGEKSCTKPPEHFSPIGIGMTERDGQTELLVGNFGPQKSIQMFAVLVEGENVSLQWRGCVMAPAYTYFGDVAGLADGGFVATASSPRKEDWGKAISEIDWGKAEGSLMTWRPEEAHKGLVKPVAGHGSFNSVEASKDGKYAFATKVAWMKGGVYKFSLETGKLLGRAAVVNTDNVAWDEEGYLITVSPVTVGWEETVACHKSSHTFCPIPTTVTRINPDTLETKLVFAHDGKTVYGGGTGGAQLGDYLYLGSTAGDRLAKIPYNR